MKHGLVFSLFFWQIYLFSQPGTVIFMNGMSSAGKTSISKELMRLFEGDFESFMLDDYCWKTKIDKAKDLGYIARDMPENKARYYFIYNLSKNQQEHVYSKRTKHIRREYAKLIREKSLSGKNIIADTVAYKYREVKHLLTTLHDVPVLFVLVYCSPEKWLEHVMLRNSKQDPVEFRSLLSTFYHYGGLFKGFSELSSVVDQISVQQLQQVINMCKHYALDMEQYHQERADKKERKIKRFFEDSFGLFEDGETLLSVYPSLAYDLVVDTGKYSSKMCAQQIYNFLLYNYQFQALEQNYQLYCEPEEDL